MDNSNNKLQTIKNIQPLKIIRNYYINNSTWLDYLKKITFGNRYLENLNYFKFLKKNRKLNETINKNFVFNCNGKLIAFINKEEDIIISKTESNDIGFAIKSNLSLTDGIDSFSWDTISPDKLYYSTNKILYECIFNERDLVLYQNKYYSLSKLSKFINCFPSPKGDLNILLYEKNIEVYDIYQNLLFSKFFTTFKFVNGLYDNKSSVYIAYTEGRIIIFNLDTFDFKSYNYFPGTIIKVINNQENDNIYIFVVDKSKSSNELIMFTLDDISISSDINLNFNSYQNNDDYYRQYHYVFRPEIYSFQHNLMNLHTKILDVNLSPNDFRVGILFEEELYNQPIQNSLYIFALTKDTRDNTINKGFPLYNFGHIDGSQIVSFQFIKMLNQGYTFLMVRFENDNFIRTEKING